MLDLIDKPVSIP